MVTHELKTPLAGIRIMAETLELGAFRDAAQREALALRIQADHVQSHEQLQNAPGRASSQGHHQHGDHANGPSEHRIAHGQGRRSSTGRSFGVRVHRLREQR